MFGSIIGAELGRIVARLRPTERRRGRRWALPLARRAVVGWVGLRTNLTIRELGAVFAISKSQAHRIIADLTRRLAALLPGTAIHDRRWAWIVDGTLVPTRDHAGAAKAKNYRWSCNLQILARWADRRIVAIAGGGPGNRNDPVHFRGSVIETWCRRHRRVLADGGYRGVPELVTPTFRGRQILRDHRWRSHRKRRSRIEHVIARLKDWRVLRDHRRRARHLVDTASAVAFLHNLRIELRDSS
jgi:hypothetical protein